MADYPPTFKIPVSHDIDHIEWVKVIMVSDGDGKHIPPKEEGWSPSWLYHLKINGVKHSLFASGKLREKILQTGATQDTVIELSRLGEGTSTNWFARYVAGPQKDWSAELGEEPQEPVDDEPSAPQPRQAPAGGVKKGMPQQAQEPTQQYIYSPVQDWTVIEALIKDRAQLAKIAYDAVKKEFGDIEESELGTFARQAVVGLDYDLLAIKRNEPLSFMSMRNWIVKEAPKPPDTSTIEGKLAAIDEEWNAATKAGPQLARFFEQVTELHDGINHVNHAKAIAKKLGYDTVSGEQDARHSMVQEIWAYEDGRTEHDLSANEALEYVHQKLGRPLELMRFDPKETDDDEENGDDGLAF